MKNAITSSVVLFGICCTLFHGPVSAVDLTSSPVLLAQNTLQERDLRDRMTERAQDQNNQDKRNQPDSQGNRDQRSDQKSADAQKSQAQETPFIIPNNMRGCAILKAVEDKKDADGKSASVKKAPSKKDADFAESCNKLLSTATSTQACADLGAYDPKGHFALVRSDDKTLQRKLKCAVVTPLTKK